MIWNKRGYARRYVWVRLFVLGCVPHCYSHCHCRRRHRHHRLACYCVCTCRARTSFGNRNFQREIVWTLNNSQSSSSADSRRQQQQQRQPLHTQWSDDRTKQWTSERTSTANLTSVSNVQRTSQHLERCVALQRSLFQLLVDFRRTIFRFFLFRKNLYIFWFSRRFSFRSI